MTITADELRGYVSHGLRGSKRTILTVSGEDNPTYAQKAGRKRNAKWRAENPERHREYQRQYAKANRDVVNARVAKFAAKHPERRKLQLRAAALRYWRKKHQKQEAA